MPDDDAPAIGHAALDEVLRQLRAVTDDYKMLTAAICAGLAQFTQHSQTLAAEMQRLADLGATPGTAPVDEGPKAH